MPKPQLLGDPMETLERMRPPEGSKHPTCEAVLKLLEEAVALLRARVGNLPIPLSLTKVDSQILALAVGYGFQVMQGRSGPFSFAEARDLAQRSFVEGWLSRDFQEKIDNAPKRRRTNTSKRKKR